MSEAERIAKLNDEFRRTGQGEFVVSTQGVAALPEEDQTEIFQKVRLFDIFNEDNDPYGVRDC